MFLSHIAQDSVESLFDILDRKASYLAGEPCNPITQIFNYL